MDAPPPGLVLTALAVAGIAAAMEVAVGVAGRRERPASDTLTPLRSSGPWATPALSVVAVVVVDPGRDDLQRVAAVVLVPLLVVSAAIDLRVRRIPNVLTVPALLAGAAVCVVLCLRDGTAGPLLAALAVCAALIVLGLAWPSALGMGDAKLLAAVVLLGSAWGSSATLAAVTLSLLLSGLASGLALLTARGRGRLMPAGPFIAAGSLLVLLPAL